MNYFSKNMVHLRKRFSITQSSVSKYVGKRQSTIGNWENGATYPDLDDIFKLIQFFGISFEDLTQRDLTMIQLTDSEDEAKKAGYLYVKVPQKIRAKRNLPKYEEVKERNSLVQDSGDMKEWVSIKLLQGIDSKLDELIEMAKRKKTG
jgi:transcriptional regulator with XRE-family HTH domain